MRLEGGCHCGAVRFAIDTCPVLDLLRCNCSICVRTGFLHLIVDQARFRCLTGGDNLIAYRFGTGAAEHLFCRTCGVKSFYRPRSHPDGWSVNFNSLDDSADLATRITEYDGRDWEAARHRLG